MHSALISKNGKVCPIDVKKNKGKLGSLDSYRKTNGDCLAIKISTNNYGYNKERNILTIPILGRQIPCAPTKYIDENLQYVLFFTRK